MISDVTESAFPTSKLIPPILPLSIHTYGCTVMRIESDVVYDVKRGRYTSAMPDLRPRSDETLFC